MQELQISHSRMDRQCCISLLDGHKCAVCAAYYMMHVLFFAGNAGMAAHSNEWATVPVQMWAAKTHTCEPARPKISWRGAPKKCLPRAQTILKTALILRSDSVIQLHLSDLRAIYA